MASDKAVRAEAQEWLDKIMARRSTLENQLGKYDDYELGTLMSILDRFAAQARLEEAKWWHEMNDENNDELRRSQCCERVAELERQAGGAG